MPSAMKPGVLNRCSRDGNGVRAAAPVDAAMIEVALVRGTGSPEVPFGAVVFRGSRLARTTLARCPPIRTGYIVWVMEKN